MGVETMEKFPRHVDGITQVIPVCYVGPAKKEAPPHLTHAPSVFMRRRQER